MGYEKVDPPAQCIESLLFPTAIAAPNPLLCESLSRFLEDTVFDIIAHAPNAAKLYEIDLPDDQAMLVILDGSDQPSEVCDQISLFYEHYPEARIVVLANTSAIDEVSHAIRSGAHGYFATISTREDFIKSLELVMCGQTVIPSEGVSKYFLSDTPFPNSEAPGSLDSPSSALESCELPQFSERELCILLCLADGSSNKQIARECDIAEGTVKVHVKAILRKIKVSNRTQAAIWALKYGLRLWPNKIVPDQAVCEPAEHDPSPASYMLPCSTDRTGTAAKLQVITPQLKFVAVKES